MLLPSLFRHSVASIVVSDSAFLSGVMSFFALLTVLAASIFINHTAHYRASDTRNRAPRLSVPNAVESGGAGHKYE
jgi:hypothetical protein